MIKSLFEPDEEIKSEQEKTTNEPAIEKAVEPQYIEVNEAENLFDSPQAAFEKPDDSERLLSEDELESINSFVEKTGDAAEFSSPPFDSPENSFAETTSETKDFSTSQFDSPEILSAEETNETVNLAPPAETVNETESFETNSADSFAESSFESPNSEISNIEIADEARSFETPVEPKIEEVKPAYNNEMLFQPLAEPESFAETARKSGLAYAAAITLTASIVFMLVIGWFADLLFGSSPWGIVGGIILGSLIGFVQFFRMTAQIFKNKD